MIPEDRARVLREHVNLIAGMAEDLAGIKPGYARVFSKFLERVHIFNMNTGANYELRGLKFRGLCVQIEWNMDCPPAAGIQEITKRFKSDVVHTCEICGHPSACRAPLAGYSFCRHCMELHLAIQFG